jgi:hypothetical protein
MLNYTKKIFFLCHKFKLTFQTTVFFCLQLSEKIYFETTFFRCKFAPTTTQIFFI